MLTIAFAVLAVANLVFWGLLYLEVEVASNLLQTLRSSWRIPKRLLTPKVLGELPRKPRSWVISSPIPSTTVRGAIQRITAGNSLAQ